MHAIDTQGSISGRFSEGNPAIGQRATRVGADWLNDLQDNLLAVLAEGGITPTKGEVDDLKNAILAMIAGAIGTGDGSVPTTRQVATSGLATGGGPLSADRTITVPKATVADVQAGTEDAKAVTPAAIAGAYAFGAGGGVLPGGFVIKRGIQAGSMAEGARYVAFDAPFPTACDDVSFTFLNPTGSNKQSFDIQLVSFDQNGFTAYVQCFTADDRDTTFTCQGFRWRAEGR